MPFVFVCSTSIETKTIYIVGVWTNTTYQLRVRRLLERVTISAKTECSRGIQYATLRSGSATLAEFDH